MSDIFLPIWVRPPNKFIKYYEYDFDDGFGSFAKVTAAVYIDKNGKEQEVDAYIKWVSWGGH